MPVFAAKFTLKFSEGINANEMEGAEKRESGAGELQLDRKNYLPNEQVASSDRGGMDRRGEGNAVPTWEALLAISYYLNGFLEGSG